MNTWSKKAKKENIEALTAVNPQAADYRFDELNAAALRQFSEQGFVVIKNALTPREVCHAKALCWDFLSKFGWNRRQPKTWKSGEDVNPKGIIWAKGAGQSSLNWYCRTRPRVVQIFADIWSAQSQYSHHGMKFGVDDMLTSFDGFSVFRPWYLKTQGAERWKTQSGWWHIDQNIARCSEIETIQGLVTLYDLDKSTGSTSFVPGSHLWVQKLCPKLRADAKDFVMLKEVQKMNCRKILVCGQAGDLVLWDSRLIHCNNPAIIDKREMQKVHALKLKQYLKSSILNNLSSTNNDDNVEEKKQSESAPSNSKKKKSKMKTMEDPDAVNIAPLLRNVVYICMSPKVKVADKSVIRQRINAFESNSTCSHWPQVMHVHWTPKEMRSQKIGDVEDELVRSLIGCDMLTDPKWKHVPDSNGGDIEFKPSDGQSNDYDGGTKDNANLKNGAMIGKGNKRGKWNKKKGRRGK